MEELMNNVSKMMNGIKGDHVKSVHFLERMVDPRASHRLFYIYDMGYGGKKSPELAERELAKAASGGILAAAEVYASYLLKENRLEEAIQVMENAARDGSYICTISVGQTYDKMKNNERAYYWLKKAYEMEESKEAQQRLSILCENLEKWEEAIKWYSMDWKCGFALYRIALIYDKLNDARKHNYMLKAAEAGEPKAFMYAATHLQNPFHWYKMAAENGIAEAEYAIGVAYLKGLLGVKPNQKIAVDFLERAAEQGFVSAMVELGRLQAKHGERWLKKAADLNDPEANSILAEVYTLKAKGYKDGSAAQKNILEIAEKYRLRSDESKKFHSI
jgi:hypothetical protein